jgi:(p)ppGpp synthase/HD superfamily hydrolase
MAIGPDDRERLTRGTQLALEWHGQQTRKGSRIPYASHLLQVAGLVLEHGGDADQAVAGLLHDALEDAPSREERQARHDRIRQTFGPGVEKMVLDCTDTEEHETADAKAEWKDRKTRYLAHLRYCDERSLLVAACDKRHNLGSLLADVRSQGLATLDRFRAEKEDQVWYFEGILEAAAGRIPARLEAELRGLLEEFRSEVGA